MARILATLAWAAESVLRRLGLLRRVLPFDAWTPNARTRAALDDAMAGRKVERYESVEALIGAAVELRLGHRPGP